MAVFWAHHIAGYFREVLIYVIFVVHLGVTKSYTHKIYGTLARAQFEPATFCYGSLRPIDSVLDTQGPLSRAIPRVMVSEQSSVESRSMTNRKQGQYHSSNVEEPKDSLAQQQMDQHSYHSHIGIVAVLQYWPPNCLCRRGSLSCSRTHETQPTPGQIPLVSQT